MSMMKWLGLAAVIAGLMAGRADAAFTITFAQVGANVVATGAGSINTTGLSIFQTNSFASFVVPSLAGAVLGPETGDNKIEYTAFFSNQGGFGTSSGFFFPGSGTGPVAGLYAGANDLIVPVGYVSGSVITNSSTFSGQTFATIGLTAGTYTYSYSATNGGTTLDTFTVVIPGIGTVPEPSSLALCGIASIVGLGVARSRRRPVAS